MHKENLVITFPPPCSEAYYSRISFRCKSKEQLNERPSRLSKGEFESWLVTIKYDRFDLSYHCNFFDGFQSSHHYWMEWLRATIKFGGFSMVFGSPTIVFDGLWWLSTIGQTLCWSHTIAPVLSGHSTAFAIPCDVFENVNKMIWGRDVFFLHLACKMLFWRRNRILERIEYQLPGVGCPLTQMLSRFMATHHRPQNMKAI